MTGSKLHYARKEKGGALGHMGGMVNPARVEEDCLSGLQLPSSCSSLLCQAYLMLHLALICVAFRATENTYVGRDTRGSS